MKKLLIILSLSFFSCQSSQINKTIKKKVVLISIDGFRPDFYLDENFNTPHLKSLAQTGLYASGMLSVFPSVTYPNHTTLVTGKYPADHGILSNTRFNWNSGPTTEWYWDSKHIKVKTLWDILKENNYKSAAIHWPVSQNSSVDYLIPEIFQLPPWHTEESFDLVIKHSTKGLPLLINKELALKPYTSMQEADIWGTLAMKYIYQNYSPDLTAFHIIWADKNQHETGRDSKKTADAIAWIDTKIKIIKDSLDEKTCLIIVGDHGFMNFSKTININRLFLDKGWIKLDKENKVKSWKVIAHKSGGQAAIYLNDMKLKSAVLKLLKTNQKLGYALISQKELSIRKSYPKAIAAISAKNGYSIGSDYSKNLIMTSKEIQGQHGQLPEHQNMHTGFIANNCGQKKGKLSYLIKNTQITPTILDYLGIPANKQLASKIDL